MGRTLAVAILGGLVFTLLHVPLAWLLGPMTAVLLWRERFNGSAVWPGWLRDAGLVPLGYMMGITFTAQVAVQIAGQLPSMAAATVLTVGFGVATGWLVARRTGLSAATGVIGSIPGGLTQMTVLSEEVENADQTAVTFMQTIRVMSVIFIVPFLAVHGLASGQAPAAAAGAGALTVETAASSVSWLHAGLYAAAVAAMTWLSTRIKLPTPYLLGPMLAAAILSVAGLDAPRLPQLVIVAAQILVGTHLGVSTRMSSLANWRKLLPYSLAGGIGIVAFSIAVGWGLTLWHPMSFVTAFLATAPGGMAEMGLTGAAVHADLSVIASFQMFRILFILFAVPPLLKRLLQLPLFRGESTPGKAG